MLNKLLIIGTVPDIKNSSTYGGITTLMQNFIDYCHERSYKYLHINTGYSKYPVLNLLYFCVYFLWGLISSKIIMYNLSRKGVFIMFYYTAPLCFALGKKVVFRKFGGYFLGQLSDCDPRKRKRILALLERTDAIFVETKELYEGLKIQLKHNDHIHLFPNCRKPSALSLIERQIFRKRFVFLSRVEEAKGIDLLLTVADRLPEDYTIHIYGPIIDAKYADPGYFSGHKAKYMRALKTEEVLNTLQAYDVLVLPTSWQTEGYPGIIVEAMSIGMPVIATSIGGIPEMIQHGKNGILIRKDDEEALLSAILHFDVVQHHAMSEEAINSFHTNYNSDVINENIYRLMMNL